MTNIIELVRLHNSLGFQEEKDKASISLYGSDNPDLYQADIGGKADESAKHFMRLGPAPRPSALSFKSNLLGTGGKGDRGGGPDSRAHIELEKRCQVCQQDGNSRHNIVKAMKLACLKYKSGKVHH